MALFALSALVLTGCTRDPYADLSEQTLPEFSRVAALDLRLRELLEVPRDSFPTYDLDSVGRALAATLPPDATTEDRLDALSSWFSTASGIRPVLRPEDLDLVPSLLRSRGQGGCTSLAWAWMRMAWAMGIELRPVLLPGHVALRRPDGRYLEPLRHGMERSAAFYDSAFALRGRPGYSLTKAHPAGISAALALHCGLLEWKVGNLRQAASALELSLSLSPGLPEAEGNLGLVLESLEEAERAAFHLRRALLGDPSNLRAADRLARLDRLSEDSSP
jgi:tetratricopeptide (TPR) repeat protein